MRTKTTRLSALGAMVVALVLSLGVAACGSSDDTTGESTSAETGEAGAIVSSPDNGKVSLTIGSKNFPEQEILGEIYAQALAAAGYKTKTDLNLGVGNGGPENVEGGADSGDPEYASTALTSFFGLEPEAVPATRRKPRKRRRPNSKRKA